MVSTKLRTRLKAPPVQHGPNARPERKEPHQRHPSIESAPTAPVVSTKLRAHLKAPLVQRGVRAPLDCTSALLDRKQPTDRAPIAKTESFKRPEHRPTRRARFVPQEDPLQAKPRRVIFVTLASTKIKTARHRSRANFVLSVTSTSALRAARSAPLASSKIKRRRSPSLASRVQQPSTRTRLEKPAARTTSARAREEQQLLALTARPTALKFVPDVQRVKL